MIIISKNFSDPHKEVMNFVKEGYERAEQERAQHDALHLGKPHEITKTRAIDPAKKPEMIEADKRHDFQEGMERGLEELKANNWKITIPTKKSETAEVNPEQPVHEDPIHENPVESASMPEGSKTSLSTGEKVGIAAAGVAAAGAAGYAAYKAWKKRKAKKAAIDAEVNEFLKNNYKTK